MSHSDYIIQYVYQMAHGTDTPFMGSVLLVVLRFFSYLYEFGVCSKLSFAANCGCITWAFLNRQNLIAA